MLRVVPVALFLLLGLLLLNLRGLLAGLALVL